MSHFIADSFTDFVVDFFGMMFASLFPKYLELLEFKVIVSSNFELSNLHTSFGNCRNTIKADLRVPLAIVTYLELDYSYVTSFG